MRIRFAVTLILCFSSISFSKASSDLNRLPWADRNDLAATKNPVIPQAPAQLDFQSAPPQSADWMRDAADLYRQNAPQTPAASIDYDMQIFISTGIPSGALRQLFKQALDEDVPQRVRFVLRGFEPQRLGELLGEIRRLFPDPKEDRLIVEIDPEAFRTYGIDTVPVYLVRDEEKWYEVQGMISLEGARDNVRRRGPLVVGDRYGIKEPDILSVIEDRARNYDWSAALERAQSRLVNNLSPSFDLPTVTQDAEELFTPVFTVPEDVIIPAHDGHPEYVLARQGQRFNVLDYTRLQVPIIVFDSSDPLQRQMVKKWVAERYAQADLFVVNADANSERRPLQIALSEEFNRPVYPWFGRMTDRFGVRAVPAIVEQSGKQLRIHYVRPAFSN